MLLEYLCQFNDSIGMIWISNHHNKPIQRPASLDLGSLEYISSSQPLKGKGVFPRLHPRLWCARGCLSVTVLPVSVAPCVAPCLPSRMFVLGDSDSDCLVMVRTLALPHCVHPGQCQAGLSPMCGPQWQPSPQPRPACQPPAPPSASAGFLLARRVTGPDGRARPPVFWSLCWCVESCAPVPDLPLRDSQCSCVCTHMCQAPLSPQPVSLSPHLNNTFISTRPPFTFLTIY